MKFGRAWGLFVVVASASVTIAAGCATATPFDGTLDGDSGSGSGADDAADPALDAAHHTDTSTAHDSASGNDAATGMDASVGVDSSGVDTGTSVDTGAVDTAMTPDTATTGCSAQSVAGYVPVWIPPVAKSIKCTAAATTAIYNGCLSATATTATCTNARALYGTCYTCTFTADTAASWGPVVTLSNGVVRLNEGGCIQLADNAQSACGHSVEASNGCEDKACKAVCTVTDQASFTLYQNCVTSADNGGCSTYSSATTTCINAIPISSNAYRCVSGATFQALYTNIVPFFCGP